MPTQLFVERDPSYVVICRKLRGSMAREEWDRPVHRAASIRRSVEKGVKDMRADYPTAEAYSPLPVTVYLDPIDAHVVIADIRRTPETPIWITSMGINVLVPPNLTGLIIKRTTYAQFAEGPLPHIELGLQAAPTPLDDPEIQRLRSQNSVMRQAIDQAIGSNSEWSQLPRQYDPWSSRETVDYVVRWLFRMRDYAILESKQSDSAKLHTADGTLTYDPTGVVV